MSRYPVARRHLLHYCGAYLRPFSPVKNLSLAIGANKREVKARCAVHVLSHRWNILVYNADLQLCLSEIANLPEAFSDRDDEGPYFYMSGMFEQCLIKI